MNQLAKSNKISSADRGQQETIDGENGKRYRQRNPELGPIANSIAGSITGNAFNPIFIVAPKPEFVIQINEKTNSVGEKQRGLLSIFGIQENNLKKVRRIWTAVRRRFIEPIFQNVNPSEIAQVFCDNTFRKEDVLIVIGVIQMIIGVGTLLAGSVAYLDSSQVCSLF